MGLAAVLAVVYWFDLYVLMPMPRTAGNDFDPAPAAWTGLVADIAVGFFTNQLSIPGFDQLGLWYVLGERGLLYWSRHSSSPSGCFSWYCRCREAGGGRGD